MTWWDVFHGERVEMSCQINDNFNWMYTWYKDGQKIHDSQNVSFDTNKATLFIRSASAAFRGEYQCKGHLMDRSVSTNSSSRFVLTVYGEFVSVMTT